MKRVFCFLSCLVAIIAVTCLTSGCNSTPNGQQVRVIYPNLNYGNPTTAIVEPGAPVQYKKVAEPMPEEIRLVVPIPAPVSDVSFVVVANNLRNLNLRARLFVNDQEISSSDLIKAQTCSKTWGVPIGTTAMVKVSAEYLDGRMAAEGETKAFIITDEKFVVSVKEFNPVGTDEKGAARKLIMSIETFKK